MNAAKPGLLFGVVLSVFLLCVPARAEKTRYLPAGRDMEVRLRFGEVTRVVFPAAVEKILPATQELSLKPDGKNLYVTPLMPGVSRILWITAGGETHALKVKEGEPADETVVVVSLRHEGSVEQTPMTRAETSVSPVACLLRDLAGGTSCSGAVRKRLSKIIYQDAFMKMVATETLSLGPLTAMKAVVSNLLPTALRLSARRFEFRGVVAVALEKQWLPPGDEGRTHLYLVVDRRL